MGTRFTVDKDFNLKRVTGSAGEILWTMLKWFMVTASLAVVYYIIFALFMSTDEEKRLSEENRLYEKLYPEMTEKQQLLGDVVQDLQLRDGAIYEQIFNSKSPVSEAGGELPYLFMLSDSLDSGQAVSYVERKADRLVRIADEVNASFEMIFQYLKADTVVMPPLSVPVQDLNYARVGASVGQKFNPFYKVVTAHDGIDLIAGQGTPVLAAGDGVVSDVRRSRKGEGNVVEITHPGGYRTVYAHLEDVAVRKGETVKTGRRLANVGMSGNSFAPHLHYSVYLDSTVRNPVNHFFVSFGPEEYMRASLMAFTTGQSMD